MKRRCNFVVLVLLSVFLSAAAAKESFQTPKNGPNLGVWRITNNPMIRDHANYHNTQCWSPGGRYLCYTHWGERENGYGSKSGAEVHVYDFHKDEDRRLGQGMNPRWANTRNWLFFVEFDPSKGQPYEKGTEVKRYDPDTAETAHVAYGVEVLGETDAADQWLYGARRFRGQTPELKTVRIAIQGGEDKVEELPEVTGGQLMPNPRHPVFFTRHDHKDKPFEATRYWWDLDGKNRRIGVPTIQQCHMCWQGNGEHLLLGNGIIRGRRWDEPFPSNIHFLSRMTLGDVSPCGRSGRYICGNSIVADTRSGDGWFTIHHLSIICYPEDIADNSDIYDADQKGSPDGTKVCFVSNYDLKDGPMTVITKACSPKDTVLHVESTEGFPDSGSLTVWREVIKYERKTSTTFEGLVRQCHSTKMAPLGEGQTVTSFEARCLTDEQWAKLGKASSTMYNSIKDKKSPLLQQRQTDVYVVLVRKPDRPWLRLIGDVVQLIPGEEHYETFGYHILCDGQRITDRPIPPGESIGLAKPGKYHAVAVEWAGLESDPSEPLPLDKIVKLEALTDPPKDFSWTKDRWLVGSREASADEAKKAAEAVREIVHLYDGVIHREWYANGVIQKRDDLSADGKAIRRLTYTDGKLSLREYYDPEGKRLSREVFAPDGYITESIKFRDDLNYDHWFYDKGMPVRQIVKEQTEYRKQGEDWVEVKTK
ncbi:MAG: hypothetical protein AB1696_14135 [Planctomycetota bacterium]